jgi:nitric oxide reductase activation protein
MVREHPGLYALWGRFHTASKEQSGFHFAGLAARLARALHEPAYDDSNAWVSKGRRLFEELAERDLHDVQAFDRVARQLSIDIGKMRLAPPRDYRPAPLYRDDNVLLWNQDLPLDEDRTSPIENFEFRVHGEVPQDLRMAEGDLRRCYRYPEWDHQLEALREEWVTVIEEARPQYSGGPTARVSPSARNRLPREFERSPDRSIRLTRLPEGDELDLNAVIDCVVQQRARVAPDGRIFCRHGHRRRTTAVVLLMDLSLSTNRFVPGTFTTVIELEKQAASMMAQALDTGRDRVALHGFASSGRHRVNYHRIKEFDEPFGEAQRASLSKLRGDLSTRMGTALRHATAALEEQVADRKVILVLTDGKPSDVDVLEDDYLVEDARHAVATAAGKGVHSFCVTLDARADEYVRHIFGTRNYLIATRASAFAGHAGQTLVRLIAQ